MWRERGDGLVQWMGLKHSTRLSMLSGILQRKLFLLMLQRKCSLRLTSVSRAFLMGGFLAPVLYKASVHSSLQQFPRAGGIHDLFAEALVLPGVLDTWLSLTW